MVITVASDAANRTSLAVEVAPDAAGSMGILITIRRSGYRVAVPVTAAAIVALEKALHVARTLANSSTAAKLRDTK